MQMPLAVDPAPAGMNPQHPEMAGSEGETIRQQLAVFLHGQHDRTVDTVQARAMPEPDSLGG
jgi:hypothetical protein